MKHILLSFDSETFLRLEKNEIKFEYRKNLPDDEFMAYFYVSKPFMAISGIAHLGKREELSLWLNRYGTRSATVKQRIENFLIDCRFVVPILYFQKTSRIPLSQIRKDYAGFIVPRMYYYIDNLPLLTYLNERLTPIGNKVINTFDKIEDEFICN